MALDIFEWENGTLVEPAKVEIGGVSYDVTDAQYEGSTPISASNMNQMQTILNNNITTSINEISTYSLTEQRVGTWIDGKPIYRIYVTGTTQSSDVAVTLATGVDKLVGHEILVKRNNLSQYHPLSANMLTNESAHASPLFVNSSTISLYITNTVYKNQNFYGWIEYTKTTN